jgi:hypothetical protein
MCGLAPIQHSNSKQMRAILIVVFCLAVATVVVLALALRITMEWWH